MSATISSKKMVELIRRLAAGTERDIVIWKIADSENVESYNATISDTNIIIEGSKQANYISMTVFDSIGRVLASVDMDRLADSSEKEALDHLFGTVRLKSGAIDGHIDKILGQLPQDALQSF
jgi:hypothetical protein